MPEVIKLRKYVNRRLYDTNAGCYVTLQYVQRHVEAGRQVSVLMHPHLKDVTVEVLLEVLKSKESVKPYLVADTLCNLIRTGKPVLEAPK